MLTLCFICLKSSFGKQNSHYFNLKKNVFLQKVLFARVAHCDVHTSCLRVSQEAIEPMEKRNYSGTKQILYLYSPHLGLHASTSGENCFFVEFWKMSQQVTMPRSEFQS